MDYQKALFIFRRDLRLDDNTGLIFALLEAKSVIPAFIFTPEQIRHNPYLSRRSLQFMIESLEDLEAQLKKKGGRLYLFYGKPSAVVSSCIQKAGVDAVIVNRDYSPYSIKRDGEIEGVCKKQGIAFHSFDDALLHPPEETLKANSKPYQIYTPFYRSASHLPVPKPIFCRGRNFFSGKIAFSKDHRLFDQLLPKRFEQALGGRAHGLRILKKRYLNYSSERDILSREATTYLSAHLKFTTVSPREAYHAFKGNRELVRSLYWRDFFTSIAFFFPHVFGHSFNRKYDKLAWSYSRKRFQQWCEGKTGVPIVDAGMCELNQTGFMHNRARMIVASFLVKDLHIDWRWGEKYFASTLIDYDPAVNNGNWQWCASTGCDAQPYFRIFNPWLQQEKFDPDCVYIKKWVPELRSLPVEAILKEEGDRGSKYPEPIVFHSEEAKKSIAAYKKVAGK